MQSGEKWTAFRLWLTSSLGSIISPLFSFCHIFLPPYNRAAVNKILRLYNRTMVDKDNFNVHSGILYSVDHVKISRRGGQVNRVKRNKSIYSQLKNWNVDEVLKNKTHWTAIKWLFLPRTVESLFWLLRSKNKISRFHLLAIFQAYFLSWNKVYSISTNAVPLDPPVGLKSHQDQPAVCLGTFI